MTYNASLILKYVLCLNRKEIFIFHPRLYPTLYFKFSCYRTNFTIGDISFLMVELCFLLLLNIYYNITRYVMQGIIQA